MLAAHAGPAVIPSFAVVLAMPAGLVVLAFPGRPEAFLVMLALIGVALAAITMVRLPEHAAH